MSCCCSTEVDSTVTINADITLVRRVFTDFKAWREWNPLYQYMKVIHGDIHNKNPHQIELETAVRFFPQPTRVHVIENTETRIQWKYSSCSLSSTVTNSFTSVRNNVTQYDRQEIMAGILSGIASCFTHGQLQKFSDEMCKAMKNRCERFQNLSVTINFPIKDIYMPCSEDDVIQILLDPRYQNNAVFRPHGGKHSWAPSVTSQFSVNTDTPVIMIDTAHMQEHKEGLVFVNGKSCLAIGPGFTQGQMAKLAAQNDRCLPVTGALQESIRVGGFLASGCHGTGDYPPVSEFVQALRIVAINENYEVKPFIFTDDQNFNLELANGATVISSLDQLFNGSAPVTYAGKSLMDVVRVHFGTLGIVTQIFIETAEQFYVNAVDEVVALEKVIPPPNEENDSFVRNYLLKKDENDQIENDYLELFYSPFNVNHHIWNKKEDRRIWLKRAKKTVTPRRSCCDSSCCSNNSRSDPLGFHKNPLNNWLNDHIQLSSDDIESALLELNDRNPPVCSPITSCCLSLFGYLANGLGLNQCCSGIVGSIEMCFGVNSHKYTVPFNSFSLYQRIAPEKIWDTEMEIPIDLSIDHHAKKFRAAWWYVLDEVDKSKEKGQFPLNLMFHCRFNRRSKSILSSCYSPISEENSHNLWFATIEFLSVTGGEDADENRKYKEYFQEFVNNIMNYWLHVNDEYIKVNPEARAYLRPRPHFAKNWYDVKTVRDDTVDLFTDNILLFDQARAKIDPNNKFYGGLVPLFVEAANIQQATHVNGKN
eukprot:gene7207-9835_t